MTSWQFPSKEQWLQAWEAAHVVYAEDVDPDESVLCQALLWQARAICYKDDDQS
jgi:hypothetical protein